MPVYVALKNPYVIDNADDPTAEWDTAGHLHRDIAEQRGNDGIIVQNEDGSDKLVIAFRPEQVKSAIGNRGTFDPSSASVLASRSSTLDLLREASTKRGLSDLMADQFQSQRTFNAWWHRAVGTQYHKAKTSPEFKRVYDAGQDYLHDISAFATDAAGLAKRIVPQMESIYDVRPDQLKDDARRPAASAEKAAVGRAIFEGTLRDERVYDEGELRSRFGLDDRGVALYREFRAAVDRSLDTLVASDVARYLGRDIPPAIKTMISGGDIGRFKGLVTSFMQSKVAEAEAEVARVRKANKGALADMHKRHRAEREQRKPGMGLAIEGRLEAEMAALKGRLDDAMDAATAEREKWERSERHVRDKYATISELKAKGYAPLMRFGRHSVYVTRETPDGGLEQVFFGLYESQREANRAAREFRGDPGNIVEPGVMSAEQHRLFAGMTPETVELFAELSGVEQSEAFQQYLKLAKASRSAMKRLIHRKGIAGYSEDVGRVLASFVTSNARAASSNLHLGDMADAISEIPKANGDVIDEAIKLKEYVQNPQEEAQQVRGLLFAQYLGGSVASALVNMTQPLTMTFPWLAQHGGAAKAATRLTGAISQALTKIAPASALGRALERAEKEGIVSPQELYQLQAEASRSMGNQPIVRKALFVWGSLFSLAEQFNRRVTFIAAYNTATAEAMADPFAFAAGAVDETQGVYNRGNRPNWARGAVGSTLFTFKQFSISYMEFLKRLPPKERALALAVLVLAAGLQGLPGADDLDDVIDTLAQALGYDFNAKLAKTRFLTSVLGQGGAEFVMRGFSALPGFPLDVSSRMSVGNLIPGTGMLLKSRTDKANEVLEAIGPVGGFARDVFGAISTGNPSQAMPLALRNLDKAIEMYQTGQYRDTRGRRVLDVGGVDAAVKAVGFQPAEVAHESRKIQMANQQVQLARNVESEIAAKWAEGVHEGDAEKIKAAVQRMRDWNEKNPDSRIRINSAQIARRVREMRMSREERFLKRTPKEMRGAVQ